MPLRVRSLRFRYAGSPIDSLGGVDLDVAPGEIRRILGPHGSGKSTLLHCISGIAPELRAGERQGSITLAGSDLMHGRLRDRADRLAFVFQDFEAQLFSTSVDLEAAFGPENLGLDPTETRRRAAEALGRVGLAGFERRAPATLSGGEKQRLAIACALAMRPELLLLDDPGSDLDPQAREQLSNWVLGEGDPPRVLWVEPDLEEVGAEERVLWLEGGRARGDGPAERVLADRAAQHPEAVPDLVRLFGLLGEREVILDPLAAARWLGERGWQAVPHGEHGLKPAAAPAAVPDNTAAEAAIAELERTRAGAPPGSSIVIARGLRHAYQQEREVLRGVDLEVAPGDSLAILGPNGSGKTTLVRCLCGFERPSMGEVRIGQTPAASLDRAQAAGRIGYVTQNPDHQIFCASVRDELVFGPRHRGIAENLWRQRLPPVLAALELAGLEERDPFSLTKGERQRVAVGAILMNDPAVLILDEPTTGLDAAQQARLMSRLDRMRVEGRALVMVTHSLRLAARYSRRVILLRAGRVVAEGSAAELLSDPAALESAGLRPLPITQTGWLLGVRAVSPEALAARLRRRGEPPR